MASSRRTWFKGTATISRPGRGGSANGDHRIGTKPPTQTRVLKFRTFGNNQYLVNEGKCRYCGNTFEIARVKRRFSVGRGQPQRYCGPDCRRKTELLRRRAINAIKFYQLMTAQGPGGLKPHQYQYQLNQRRSEIDALTDRVDGLAAELGWDGL